jgi:hypothetical protein
VDAPFSIDDTSQPSLLRALHLLSIPRRWWHEYAMRAKEIRFVRGRLKFGGAKYSAPFPSVILVYGAQRDD